MFGFFKKNGNSVRTKISNDFADVVRAVKAADREKQALVGRGIQEAESLFSRKYERYSFQNASYADQMKYIAFIRDMEVRINGLDGPLRITAIGYSLFNKWLGAIMLSDDELIREFEVDFKYLKGITHSYL